MTNEEYKKRLEILESDFEEKKDAIARKYAVNNAKFTIGDIIKYNDDIILIDKLTWGYDYVGEKLPIIYYSGALLKKDLTKRKYESRAKIKGYSEIKKIN